MPFAGLAEPVCVVSERRPERVDFAGRGVLRARFDGRRPTHCNWWLKKPTPKPEWVG